MSFTNKTPNLNLPQWQDTDEPTWLVDMNNAFSDIDSAVHANQQGNEGNEAQINALATQLTSTVEKVDKTVEDLGNDHALLVQIDAQHKINTQHIADLQEDLNGEVSNREAADTALEGKIAQNTTGITQNTDNIGALQGQVTELTAKVEQQGTEVEQFDARLNTQDEAITGIQTNVTALQSGQEEVTAKVTEIQTDVTNNMGDISTLQADNTVLKSNVQQLHLNKPKVSYTHNIRVTQTTSQSNIALYTTDTLVAGYYVIAIAFSATEGVSFYATAFSWGLYNSVLMLSALQAGDNNITFHIIAINDIPTNKPLFYSAIRADGNLIPNFGIKQVTIFKVENDIT